MPLGGLSALACIKTSTIASTCETVFAETIPVLVVLPDHQRDFHVSCPIKEWEENAVITMRKKTMNTALGINPSCEFSQ